MANFEAKIRGMKHAYFCMLSVVGLLSLVGCSATKFVPDGQYLLNKATVKVEDTHEVLSQDLRNYLQQNLSHQPSYTASDLSTRARKDRFLLPLFP